MSFEQMWNNITSSQEIWNNSRMIYDYINLSTFFLDPSQMNVEEPIR